MESVQAASTSTARGRKITAALWFGVIAGPIAVLVNEAVEYILAFWGCGLLHPTAQVLLHIVPAVLLLLTIISGAVAWAHRTRPLETPADVTIEEHNRPGFMAVLGMGIAVMSALALIAQWIPVFYLSPCVRT